MNLIDGPVLAEEHVSPHNIDGTAEIFADVSLNAASVEPDTKCEKFDKAWVNALHKIILREQASSVEKCKWSFVLDKWKELLHDAPVEKVEFGCVESILQRARLTPIPQPRFYETLRRLGKDIINIDVGKEEVCRKVIDRLLDSGNNDKELYSCYFDNLESWKGEPKQLTNHLEKMHGLGPHSSQIDLELRKERMTGFIVPHLRSNRYHPVELAAILRNLIREIPGNTCQHFASVADRLEKSEHSLHPDPLVTEAQEFILRCFDNIFRAKQSFEGAVKRNAAVGVILFGYVHDGLELMCESSDMDEWYETEAQKGFDSCTLLQFLHLIRSEGAAWKKWEQQLKERSDLTVAKQELFSIISPKNLSSPSLFSQISSKIKSYMGKKQNLKALAEKSGRESCVTQTAREWKNDVIQVNGDMIPVDDESEPRGKNIAVFGYTLNHDNKGIPETAEQSVIIRSVPLLEIPSKDKSSTFNEMDTRIFELGVSLSGNYLDFVPNDAEELQDMLKTSGIGLNREDHFRFFKFVRQGQHIPRARSIDDIFLNSKDEAFAFTHALLILPDLSARPGKGAAYSEIADAGGRFLVDLRWLATVKAEGIQYHSLSVEFTASVAADCVENTESRTFYRMALLLHPNISNDMPSNFKLDKLTKRGERGGGFQESAEIFAEVLSLAAIDESKIEDGANAEKYRKVIKDHLEGNPLLLYYTSMNLLNAVDESFGQIIAEYWSEKLGLGPRRAASSVSSVELESRKIVLSLITSYVPRAVASTMPEATQTFSLQIQSRMRNRQSAADDFVCLVGKKLAVATEAHLHYIPGIILQDTHFAQEEIFVEETNFESVLARMQKSNPTSLTFIIIYVTGKILRDQIQRLVSIRNPNLKLIFQHSHTLMTLLNLTSSICDLMYRPESINMMQTHGIKPVKYSDASCVGSLVNFNSKFLVERPESMLSEACFWESAYPESVVERECAWKTPVKDWLAAAGDECCEDFARIIVCVEHHRVSRDLGDLASTLKPPLKAHVLDAGNRKCFEDLKAFLNRRNESLKSGQVQVLQQRDLDESGTKSVSEVFVLSNASFLPQARLEALVSRCFSNNAKLILLTSEPMSKVSRFRLFKNPKGLPSWMQVPTIVASRHLDADFGCAADVIFSGLQLLCSYNCVIKDHHFKNLQKYLDSNMNDSSALDFLNHVDSLPTDFQFRNSFIAALGTCKDEEISVDVLLKKSLADILCVHINRYIFFREDTSKLVSFKDFVTQPKLRFLSQIHRIEAYMCYIFSRTGEKHRLRGSAFHSCPLGFPISGCFSNLVSNLHSADCPGVLLTAILERNAPIDELGSLPVLEAQYMDPGRGDIVTQVQEIVEQRAVNGAELHWEDMSLTWASGPDISADVLDHVLIHSPSRLSIMLCLTSVHINALNLSELALKAIAHDFEGCEEMFRQLPTDKYKLLRTRVAAIWWLLLLEGLRSSKTVEPYFAEYQTLLAESGNYVDPKPAGPDRKSMSVNQLLCRIARAMIPLDAVDILSSQHTVRNFLLSNQNIGDVAAILNDSSVRIGQNFVNVLVTKETLNGILDRLHGQAISDLFWNVLKWIKDSNSADVHEMRRETNVFASRLTPLGLSCLLLNANPPVDLSKACRGLVEPCIKHVYDAHGSNEASLFLDQVLEPLCTDRHKALAIEFFDVLSQCSLDSLHFPSPTLKGVGKSWGAIFQAMLNPQEMDTMLATVRMEGFSLPFEDSERLCELYVGYFLAEGRDAERDIDYHVAILKSDGSKSALYKFMTEKDDGIQLFANKLSALSLLWFVWWSKPFTSFPIHFFPKPETWTLFQRVMRRIDFKEETLKKGLSTLARFSLAPHTLPASSLNALKTALVGGDPVVVSEKYVLAQMDSKYPVYGFRCHSRSLPRKCVDALISEVSKCGTNGIQGLKETEKYKSLFPVTDSGVSTDIIKHNLNILVHIHESPESIEPDKTLEMRAQISCLPLYGSTLLELV